MDNLQPAYDFWTTLAEQGRIDTGDTSTARIESGEIACGLFWDYNSLNYRDNAVANNPEASFHSMYPFWMEVYRVDMLQSSTKMLQIQMQHVLQESIS